MAGQPILVVVNGKEIEGEIRRSPRDFNLEFNRGMKTGGRKFGVFFMARTPIKVHKKSSRKPSGRHPALPPKMKSLGFQAILGPRKKLHGKEMVVRTSNQQVIAHEEGARITPQRARFLAVKVRRPADARKAGLKRGAKLPVTLRARAVTIKAQLGFMRSFGSYQSSFKAQADTWRDRGVARAQRRFKK